MQKIIKQLETENEILEQHLSEITRDSANIRVSSSSGVATPSLNSPAQEPCIPATKPPAEMLGNGSVDTSKAQGEVSLAQERTSEILQTASITTAHANGTAQTVSLVSSEVSTVSMSPTPYQHRDNTSESPSQAINEGLCVRSHELPSSITTTDNRTAIDC